MVTILLLLLPSLASVAALPSLSFETKIQDVFRERHVTCVIRITNLDIGGWNVKILKALQRHRIVRHEENLPMLKIVPVCKSA